MNDSKQRMVSQKKNIKRSIYIVISVSDYKIAKLNPFN